MVGTLLRGARSSLMQIRKSSGFNKYPPKAIKPLGLSGNAMLIVGLTFCVFSISMVQRSGYFIPHTLGPGWSPVGKLEIDLTPEGQKAD